ncbi:MAG: DNA-3-methyladenine glycosylase, partial [Gaiellaceae bacterium]|nr:DNA-3-methyladenine glycosylase [Gaiellaceae bacterium]
MSAARAFCARDARIVARELVGATLLKGGVGGVIVETEAYVEGDPASHSYRGRTRRNAAMFGPPGTLYVYRSYGLHWCANVVCGEVGEGAAVLLRALEPTHGIEEMRRRRGVAEARALCAGPGRLCQALAITSADDGRSLDEPPFELRVPKVAVEVIASPRVGITRARELLWRYCLKGSAYVS